MLAWQLESDTDNRMKSTTEQYKKGEIKKNQRKLKRNDVLPKICRSITDSWRCTQINTWFMCINYWIRAQI